MSGRHVRMVFDRSDHRGHDLLVLLCIAEALNEHTGVWDLYVAEIADRCNMNERQVYRALAKLRASADLIVKKHGGRGGRNLYRLGALYQAGAALDAGVDHGDLPPQTGQPAVSVSAGESERPAATDRGDLPPQTGQPVATDRGDLPPQTAVTTLTTNTTLTTEDEDMGKRRVEAMLADLKAVGIKGARDTPKLREAIKLGAVAGDVVAAVDASSGAENPFAYGVAVLVNRLKAGPAPGLACWEDAPRSVVEAKAMEAGIGPWDELREQFPAYKARVGMALRVHQEQA